MKNAFETSGTSPTRSERSAVLPPPDICLDNHGSIFLVRPVSSAGQRSLQENVIGEETQLFGTAVVCEPRFVLDIVLGARAEGVVIRRFQKIRRDIWPVFSDGDSKDGYRPIS